MWAESERAGELSAANERAGIMSDLLLSWAVAIVSGKSALYYIIRVSKNLRPKIGISQFSVETFFSHSAENFRGEPLLVSEKLGYRRNFHIRRPYHNFLLKQFLPHSAETFRGEPFIDSEKIKCQKTL